MYIPENLVDRGKGSKMKVQKIVSLDEKTMRISQKMDNFSQWVRMGLRSYDNGEDLATETMRRIKWAKVSHIFAALIIEKAVEIDPNFKGSIEDLIADAMKEVKKQTSLRDFEWESTSANVMRHGLGLKNGYNNTLAAIVAVK